MIISKKELQKKYSKGEEYFEEYYYKKITKEYPNKEYLDYHRIIWILKNATQDNENVNIPMNIYRDKNNDY